MSCQAARSLRDLSIALANKPFSSMVYGHPIKPGDA